MKIKTLLKKSFRSEHGGIDTIIATVVSIILVLGLIAYALLSQVSGVKDVGDKAEIEQNKITQMLHESNVVTGNTVRNYARQAGNNLSVGVKVIGANGTLANDYTPCTTETAATIKEGSLYRMTKKYNSAGELNVVNFDQIDLSK